VAALLLTAGWTAVAAWRFREAAAHIGALIVGFWGVVLAAEQVLPRVGYAAEGRTWACVAPAPRRVAPVVPRALPPAVADSAAAGDSTTLPDSAGAGVADTSAAPR